MKHGRGMKGKTENNIRKDELMAVGRHGDSRLEDETSQVERNGKHTHTHSEPVTFDDYFCFMPSSSQWAFSCICKFYCIN